MDKVELTYMSKLRSISPAVVQRILGYLKRAARFLGGSR